MSEAAAEYERVVEAGRESGDVELEAVRSDSMKVATGSGDIGASAIESERCHIGTGSGDVKLVQ